MLSAGLTASKAECGSGVEGSRGELCTPLTCPLTFCLLELLQTTEASDPMLVEFHIQPHKM